MRAPRRSLAQAWNEESDIFPTTDPHRDALRLLTVGAFSFARPTFSPACGETAADFAAKRAFILR